jgi:hypothetical protein
MGLYPDDGIAGLVEIGGSAESLNRNVVFLNLVRLAVEVPIAHVLQHLRQDWRTSEDPRRQHSFELSAFHLEIDP